MKLIIRFILLFTVSQAFAQDNMQQLSYEAFIDQVMQNHPIAQISNNTVEGGDAVVTRAKGEFDPLLFGDVNQKYFSNSQYYSNANGGLKIPTWFGLSAEAGYIKNDGIYLNPENRTPDIGLWYAGLRLELGQGLIIDKRRAELKKAKVIREGTILDQKILLNELKRDASMAYWKWAQAYSEVSIYKEALQNAVIRFEGVKSSAEYGFRPYIDTVEALIVVQSRSVELSKSEVKYQNAELQLEIYLWDKGFIPLELDGVVPDLSAKDVGVSLYPELDSLINNHPYIQLNELKIQQNQIDLQLKKEQLKPKVSLKYNALSEPVGNDPFAEYSSSNYSWGASVAYPIFTRKERGDVQFSKLKLENQELSNVVTMAEINYKVKGAYNDYTQSLEQYVVLEQLVENNQLLYSTELKFFNIGESSVFMFNSRETKLLKTQIEFVEIQNKVQMLKNELDYMLMTF